MSEYQNQQQTIPKTEMPVNEKTIIIDIGQATTKVGFTGHEKPKAVFPTVVGKPKYKMMTGGKAQEIYVGNDTTRMRGVLKLEYPIDRGQVINWDAYYAILNHIFYNILRVDPKECNIIYLVPPLTPPDIAQYFARVLFETHQCKRVAILDSATTAVFSIGETTALSVEIGAGISSITPVMDGQIYGPSIRRLNLAGEDIEEYLGKLLTQYGIFQKREIVKDIKEKEISISENPEEDAKKTQFAKKYMMPDGETLEINSSISLMAGEILFNPELLITGVQSLPKAIITSLKSVNSYYWRPMLNKIVLTGGSSHIKGLKNRLRIEIENNLGQLGEMPPEPIPEVESKPTSENSDDHFKKMDNCPKCGELVDFSESEFCPSCGAVLKVAQIDILDAEKDKLSRKEKKIIKKTAIDEDDMSKIAADVADEYGSKDELEMIENLEKKLDEQINVQHETLNKLNIPSPPTAPIIKHSKHLVNVIIPEEKIFASYKGASILASLSSFQQFMINRASFELEPQKVIVNFSEVISQRK